MDQRDFKLETTFTDRNNTRWLATALAAVLLTGIALTIWTSLPEALLPMTDESMRALVPQGVDGAEPLALKTVNQELQDGVLSVAGVVENRSNMDIETLLVVIEATGISGRPAKPVEAPVETLPLMAHRTSNFQVTAMMDERPGTFKVRFRIPDGPFVPHKDERSTAPPKSDK